MGIQEIVDLLNAGGVLALLVLFFAALQRGWFVLGRELKNEVERRKEIEQERNDWRSLALRGTNMAEQTVNLFRERG